MFHKIYQSLQYRWKTTELTEKIQDMVAVVISSG